MAEQIANVEYCNSLSNKGNAFTEANNLCVNKLMIDRSDRVTFVSYPSTIYTDNQLVRKCDIVATQQQIIEKMNPSKVHIYNKSGYNNVSIPKGFKFEITIVFSYKWEKNDEKTTSTIYGYAEATEEKSIYQAYETYDINWSGGIPDTINNAYYVNIDSVTVEFTKVQEWMLFTTESNYTKCPYFRYYRRYYPEGSSSGATYAYKGFIGEKNKALPIDSNSGTTYTKTWISNGSEPPPWRPATSGWTNKEILYSLYQGDGWIIGLCEDPNNINDPTQ